jgi:hypothetical protein
MFLHFLFCYGEGLGGNLQLNWLEDFTGLP